MKRHSAGVFNLTCTDLISSRFDNFVFSKKLIARFNELRRIPTLSNKYLSIPYPLDIPVLLRYDQCIYINSTCTKIICKCNNCILLSKLHSMILISISG